MRRLLVLLVLAAAAAADDPVRIDLKPDDIPLTRDWFGVYINSRKSGYGVISLERERDAYVMRTDVSIKLFAMGQDVTMQVLDEQRFALEPPYVYLGGRMDVGAPNQRQQMEAKRTGDHLQAKVTTAGKTRDMKLLLPDYTLADVLVAQIWVLGEPKKGDRITVRAFDLLTLNPFATNTIEVVSVDDTIVYGVATVMYSCRVTSSVLGPMGISRLTGKGQMISSTVGGFAEIRREPEEVAKKLEQGGDLFVESFAKVDRRIGSARKLVTLVLDITGGGAAQIEAGPQQSVEQRGDRGVRVRLGPAEGAPVRATPAEQAENLKETVGFPVANEKIRALAREAVGDATTDADKVARLVRFVSQYVENELRPEFVSVLDVVESKRGDCQEHSILFATLARAAGIPARTIGGLAYVDDVQALVGHAWNEVVLDGHWVPVDATWEETVVDAGHLRVGAGWRGLTQMSWVIGRLDCKVVSSKRGALKRPSLEEMYEAASGPRPADDEEEDRDLGAASLLPLAIAGAVMAAVIVFVLTGLRRSAPS